MNRPRESEHFFHYHYGWSFAFAASSFLLKEGAGVMSVYLFMKRYAEEELYRPHPTLYRPRLSHCSDYSGQYLHPDAWAPAARPRSPSDASSSDISIQLNQASPPPGSSAPHPQIPSSSSGPPSSAASYQLQLHPATTSFASSSGYPPHPLHPASTATLPRSHHLLPHHGAPPAAVPPPHYHAHMRMSASPC
ncbi:unnamed protein product [Lota lota]